MLPITSWQHWLPSWIEWSDHQPRLAWCYTHGEQVYRPFFYDLVSHFYRQPLNRYLLRRSALREVPHVEECLQRSPPKAFIFHLSRCGSTLLARLLSALPHSLVLSEPDPVEALLHAPLRHPGISEEQQITWLRQLLAGFALYRAPALQHIFIKLDNWSISALPLLQKAFPGTPCVFLYRDPVEVMASHQRQAGQQMVPGLLEPELFGLQGSDLATLDFYDYRLQVLAHTMQQALALATSDGLQLMHYPRLPAAVAPWCRDHLGLDLDADTLAQMQVLSQGSAKHPEQMFRPDGQQKRIELPPDLAERVHLRLDGLYQALLASPHNYC